MSTQMLTKISSILDRIYVTPIIQLDENFYEDEQVLAAGLSSPAPGCLQDQPLPEIDPGEFEHRYCWYLS